VITGVQPGNNLAKVPLTAVGLPASINGQLTSSNGSAGVAIDVTVSALQPISNSTQVTVPLAQQSASTATLSTSSGTCPAGTDCANYTFSLPAANPSIGAVNLSGDQAPAAPGAGAVNYTVDGLAFVLGGNTPNCTQPEQQAVVNNVTAGNPFSAAALVFTGCN
jgi:hypothetical protein